MMICDIGKFRTTATTTTTINNRRNKRIQHRNHVVDISLLFNFFMILLLLLVIVSSWIQTINGFVMMIRNQHNHHYSLIHNDQYINNNFLHRIDRVMITKSVISSYKRSMTFHPYIASTTSSSSSSSLLLAKGFGSISSNGNDKNNNKKQQQQQQQKNRLVRTLEENDDEDKSSMKKKSKKNIENNNIINKPFVKSEQEQLIQSITDQASKTDLGIIVTETINDMKKNNNNIIEMDPFWELIPTVLLSRFPDVIKNINNDHDDTIRRIAGFLRYSINPSLIIQEINDNDIYRPINEIHAYMPGLGKTQPFYESNQFSICTLLNQYYDIIVQEYNILHEYLIQNPIKQKQYGYQSVTSLNYDSGWKTLILFYNGHRINGFPYHLCPITTKILETVPIAGRIAGFNCQQPNTGIPIHTDGNNMWLTCQMGIDIPTNQTSYIQVSDDRRYWNNSECIVYDTTYQHYTKNDSPNQQRIVLHVDFFNTLVMKPIEIEIMQYIYTLREQYMKAEGNTKVNAQIL